MGIEIVEDNVKFLARMCPEEAIHEFEELDATTALLNARTEERLHDAADNAAVVHPLDTPNIRRQVRFDPLPLLIAQPKTGFCARSQSPSKNESGSYCQSGKINEF
jgi:hypothetical protein